jgi:hypothetical protein
VALTPRRLARLLCSHADARPTQRYKRKKLFSEWIAMKHQAWLALTLWISSATIARAEIETYHFTGTVAAKSGTTFFGGLSVPSAGTAITGQFQYNSATTAYKTAPLSGGGAFSVYPQNITGGFSANFGSVSVAADTYTVNVINDQPQPDGGAPLDIFQVQWLSIDDPQPTTSLKVNGINESQYVFTISLNYPSNTWNGTSLPSSLPTSGFSTTNFFGNLLSQASGPINVLYDTTSLTPAPILRGDWNHDGLLTSADLSTMLGAITNINMYTQNLQNSGYSQNQCMTICDVNGDGKITNADVQAEINLLRNTGTALVPEPTSFVLLGISIASLIAWGRKL